MNSFGTLAGAGQVAQTQDTMATGFAALERNHDNVLELLRAISDAADLVCGPRPPSPVKDVPTPTAPTMIGRLRQIDTQLNVALAFCMEEIRRLRSGLGMPPS